MSNMENLSFDEGLKSYKINGDPNRILRFNPGDVNILTRYKEVVNNLNEIANELPDAKIKPDGTAEDNAEIVGAQLTAFNETLKKQINYLFNADVYDVLFAGQSPLCRVGTGRKLLCEEIIEKLGRLIGDECGETVDNVNLRVSKYTAEYEGNREYRRNKNKQYRKNKNYKKQFYGV